MLITTRNKKMQNRKQTAWKMGKIEFIPVIELPTKKDNESKVILNGTPLNNSAEWDLYQEKELKKNYNNIPKSITNGVYQYRLFDIKIEDLEKAIKLHIGDIDIEKSCSLFGGYAISINEKVELYPQCCGLLEEIQQWKQILNENFEDFYLLECHPSPLITKRGNKIVIYCKDEFESFYPFPTKEIIELEYKETKIAFLKMLDKLNIFCEEINKLSSKLNVSEPSNILIWGRNENE